MHALMTDDADTLRQVARGWRYAYGPRWVAAPALWTECTCSPGHDSLYGCDLGCTVCEVVASLPDRLVTSS